MKIKNKFGGHIIANQRKNYLLENENSTIEDAFYFAKCEDISKKRMKEYLKSIKS